MDKRYISITDYRTPSQVTDMLQVFREAGGPAAGLRHDIGVMMSRKVLVGLQSEFADRYPRIDEVRGIFHEPQTPDSCHRNVLHFADYVGTTKFDDLLRAAELSGPHLGAIQFDMIWPDPVLLNRLRAVFLADKREIPFLFQANSSALHYVANSPARFLSRLKKEYDGVIDTVLFDPSGGNGISLNPYTLMPYLDLMLEKWPEINLAVAGGLGPYSLPLLNPLHAYFQYLSIDAQSKLRQSGSTKDPIDWPYAAKYLRAGIALLGLQPRQTSP